MKGQRLTGSVSPAIKLAEPLLLHPEKSNNQKEN
jgi:hypothetical protein